MFHSMRGRTHRTQNHLTELIILTTCDVVNYYGRLTAKNKTIILILRNASQSQ